MEQSTPHGMPDLTEPMEPQGGGRDATSHGAPHASTSEGPASQGLPSDHPLLRGAQEALRRQLQASKLRLQEELREKQISLQVCLWLLLEQKTAVLRWLLCVSLARRPHCRRRSPLRSQTAKQRREEVGVELYGYQQHLGKLRGAADESAQQAADLAAQAESAGTAVAALRQQAQDDQAALRRHEQAVAELQASHADLEHLQANHSVQPFQYPTQGRFSGG
jgi:hypothetical protein